MPDNVNVFAPELRNTIRKECPIVAGAYIDFYDDLTVDMMRQAQEAFKDPQNIEANLKVILNQIADWNFAGADGKKLAITSAVLESLGMKLLTWIGKAQTEVLDEMASDRDEGKKKSGEKVDKQSEQPAGE